MTAAAENKMPRRLVIVAPHFPASNLTAGHRTGLLLRHLPEFGQGPTVLTVARPTTRCDLGRAHMGCDAQQVTVTQPLFEC